MAVRRVRERYYYIQEDFDAEQSAPKFLTPVTSPALTAKFCGQGDMVDATSMAHPWKVSVSATDM